MTSARRFLPAEPADFLRAVVPIALLAVAAAIPATRLVIAVLLVTGTAVAIGRNVPVRWAWADRDPCRARHPALLRARLRDLRPIRGQPPARAIIDS